MGSSLSGWEVSDLVFTLEKCANHAAGLKLLSILLGKAEPLCRKKRPLSFIKPTKEETNRNKKKNKGRDKKKHINEDILGRHPKMDILEEKGVRMDCKEPANLKNDSHV